MSSDYMVTTMDNEWNPFTHWREWWDTDHARGHNTCEKLDDYCKTTIMQDDKYIDEDIDFGVELFLENNVTGLWYKLYREDGDKVVKMANKAFNDALSEAN
jgi:hypothetical protein